MAVFSKYERRLLANRPKVSGITVDGPLTKDMDDGVDVQRQGDNAIIAVSIADVPFLVRAGSGPDLTAYERGYTLYLSEGNIPMLPRVFSEDRLSLVPNLERPAITITLTLDNNLNVLNRSIQRTAFTSRQRLDYETCTAMITGEDPTLAPWYQIATGLLEKRRQSGALFIYDLKKGISVDDEGKIVAIKESEHKAQVLIQELMILTNQAVAEYALNNRIPLLYRNHRDNRSNPIDRETVVNRLVEAIEEGNINLINQIRRELEGKIGRAHYAPDCEGHFGLNLPAYAHFTSPIRRYADLVNQRLLIDAIEHAPVFSYEKSDLFQIGTRLNQLAEDDKESKTNYFNRRSQLATARAIAAAPAGSKANELPPTLTRNQLTSALINAAREPTLDDNLASIMYGLIADRNIAPDEVFTILARTPKDAEDWKPLRRLTLEYLQENVGIAVGAFMHAIQKFPAEWANLVFNDVTVGNGFRCDIDLLINQEPVHFEGPIRAQKREAKNIAALMFWADFSGQTIELESATLTQTASTVKSGPPRISAANKNPISALAEFCQAARLTFPVERYSDRGPDHMRSFACRLELTSQNIELPIVAEAEGSTKKNAKSAAAQRLLDQLQEQGLVKLVK